VGKVAGLACRGLETVNSDSDLTQSQPRNMSITQLFAAGLECQTAVICIETIISSWLVQPANEMTGVE
jgi:hypothetical protein